MDGQADCAGQGRVRYGADAHTQRAAALCKLWLEAQLGYDRVPGISVAVTKDQELVWSGGFGWADKELSVPARADGIYGIASVTKLFTAIAVLQLRDQGLISLDEPLASYLPEFAPLVTPGSAPITVGHILAHRSGLPRDGGTAYWSEPFTDFPSYADLIRAIGSRPALYPTDTTFNYSNLGYALAGELVARVSGLPYGDYLKARILGPLGLTDTALGLPAPGSGGEERLATGYSSITRQGAQRALPRFDPKAIAPAAGLSSTALDLARFLMWQCRVLAGGPTEVLSQATLREMQSFQSTEASTAWSLGFTVWEAGGKRYAGHGGICAGYRSQCTLMLEDRLGVAVLCNSSGANAALYAQRVCEIFSAALAQIEANPDAGKPTDPELKAFEGIYDGTPWGGDCAVFAWNDCLASLDLPTTNPLAGIELLERKEGTRFKLIADSQAMPEDVTFEADKNGAIARLWYEGNFKPKISSL